MSHEVFVVATVVATFVASVCSPTKHIISLSIALAPIVLSSPQAQAQTRRQVFHLSIQKLFEKKYMKVRNIIREQN